MNKIALYGGSFDPIHIGHLITATNVLETLKLDKIIFIPSNITPLKNSNLKAKNIDRYNMIKKSIFFNNKFEVSDYEIKQDCISYTYNTVKYFKDKYKNTQLYFLIGTDRVKDLYKWYNIEKLAKIVTFIFVARDKEKIDDIIKNNDFYKKISYEKINLPIFEISSSEIRDKIKNKKSVDYMITKECAEYIKEMNLYEL